MGDEGAELDDLGDLAQVGLANLGGLDEVAALAENGDGGVWGIEEHSYSGDNQPAPSGQGPRGPGCAWKRCRFPPC
jgi:hypothetical protein